MRTEKPAVKRAAPGPLKLALLSLFIIAANAFDCYVTLKVTEGGRGESMPFARWALELGPAWFVAWKMSIVAGAVAIGAVIARRHRRTWFLYLAAAVYAALSLYYGIMLFWVAFL